MQYLILGIYLSILGFTSVEEPNSSNTLLPKNYKVEVQDSLRLDLSIEILKKALPKWTSVCLTPKIGTSKFHSIWIQGSKAKTKYPVVPSKKGGIINYFDVIQYDKSIDMNQLKIEVTIIKGSKKLENRTIDLQIGNQNIYIMKNAKTLFRFSSIKINKT